MIVRAVDFEFQLRDSFGREMGVGRGEGLHLSHVLNYLDRHGLGINYDDREPNDLWAATGFMFEILVSNALAVYLSQDNDRIITGRELCMDGILLTPDAYDTVDDVVGEMKATWKSARKIRGAVADQGHSLRVNFGRWLRQIMSYCRAYETRKARLYSLFVMGDYSYGKPSANNPNPLPAGPALPVLDLEFTADEIEDNWRMILLNAADAAREAGIVWRR